MKKLLNTLYITNEQSYISLQTDNVIVKVNGEKIGIVPLVILESIVCFNYFGATPELMGRCAELGIPISFLAPNGKFLARVVGRVKGNVSLRVLQYKNFVEEINKVALAKNCVYAKVHNAQILLKRKSRDAKDDLKADKLKNCSRYIDNALTKLNDCESIDSIRALEGECARDYFGVFNDMVVSEKCDMYINSRSKNPPLDATNAMLSYFYTLLYLDVVSALETVGLDSQLGFFHTERSGRHSLACDLMEELRALYVDKFVLKMINLSVVSKNDFFSKENEAVYMTDEVKKTLLQKWQEHKKEMVNHKVLGEKISLGLVPYAQAQMFAKYLRGENDEYLPFVTNEL